MPKNIFSVIVCVNKHKGQTQDPPGKRERAGCVCVQTKNHMGSLSPADLQLLLDVSTACISEAVFGMKAPGSVLGVLDPASAQYRRFSRTFRTYYLQLVDLGIPKIRFNLDISSDFIPEIPVVTLGSNIAMSLSAAQCWASVWDRRNFVEYCAAEASRHQQPLPQNADGPQQGLPPDLLLHPPAPVEPEGEIGQELDRVDRGLRALFCLSEPEIDELMKFRRQTPEIEQGPEPGPTEKLALRRQKQTQDPQPVPVLAVADLQDAVMLLDKGAVETALEWGLAAAETGNGRDDGEEDDEEDDDDEDDALPAPRPGLEGWLLDWQDWVQKTVLTDGYLAVRTAFWSEQKRLLGEGSPSESIHSRLTALLGKWQFVTGTLASLVKGATVEAHVQTGDLWEQLDAQLNQKPSMTLARIFYGLCAACETGGGLAIMYRLHYSVQASREVAPEEVVLRLGTGEQKAAVQAERARAGDVYTLRSLRSSTRYRDLLDVALLHELALAKLDGQGLINTVVCLSDQFHRLSTQLPIVQLPGGAWLVVLEPEADKPGGKPGGKPRKLLVGSFLAAYALWAHQECLAACNRQVSTLCEWSADLLQGGDGSASASGTQFDLMGGDMPLLHRTRAAVRRQTKKKQELFLQPRFEDCTALALLRRDLQAGRPSATPRPPRRGPSRGPNQQRRQSVSSSGASVASRSGSGFAESSRVRSRAEQRPRKKRRRPTRPPPVQRQQRVARQRPEPPPQLVVTRTDPRQPRPRYRQSVLLARSQLPETGPEQERPQRRMCHSPLDPG